MMDVLTVSRDAYGCTGWTPPRVEADTTPRWILIDVDVFSRTGLPADTDSRLSPESPWYWTRGWQAREREADACLAAGHYDDFETFDAFINDLERLMND